MLGRPEAGNFPGWQHVRDRMQRTGLTREQQIYMDHLLKDPEMPAPTGRLWFGGVRICMRVGRVRLTHWIRTSSTWRNSYFNLGGYVTNRSNMSDLTMGFVIWRGPGNQGRFTSENKTTMHKGIDLLGGRTNSEEEKIGTTREFSGYNYSLPSYTNLDLPVSPPRMGLGHTFVRERDAPVCLRRYSNIKIWRYRTRRDRDNTAISLVLLVLE